MKKLLLAAFAVALAVACKSGDATNNSTADSTDAATEQTTLNTSDVAYVQVEAVIAQSDIYQKEGLPLKDKTEKSQQSWGKKQQNLQTEAAQLQEKYQKGLMTTLDAQKKQQELEQRAGNYQNAAQKELAALDEENYVFSNRMNDLVSRAIKEVNADKKYKMIVNASALLDADESLDITATVLEKVNALYKADQQAKK